MPEIKGETIKTSLDSFSQFSGNRHLIIQKQKTNLNIEKKNSVMDAV